MESYLSIFQGILSTEGTFLDIYLDGLEDHRKFDLQSNEGAELVQNISSLLTKATTRTLGLRLLTKYIDNCPIDVLEKKGNLWITLILKGFNSQEFNSDTHPIFEVLGKIINRSLHTPDLAKSFASTHISKIYDHLTKVPQFQVKYALSCIEICLRAYPASSGPSKGVIERFLWKNVDHLEEEVVQSCGKCLHLLQQVRGGGVQGVNHKTQWKNYQLQLIGGIHSVYNEMFSNCVEMYEEKVEKEKLPWEAEQHKFDTEPVKKAAQMFTRCHNLIKYLIIALREPFPVEKPILVRKILNVVIRGLSVNCLMLEQNPIADNIALSILLPKLHVDLFELLKVAVLILRGHMRPYSEQILGLIIDAIKWSSAKNEHGDQKILMVLRKQVYETVSLWCNIFNSGNRCETIAEFLFQEILSDITPTQSEFTLKVLSGARKHMSKKARRQLHNAQNEKSNMAHSHSSDTSRKVQFSEESNQELCIAALRCLQKIIFSVNNFIKPTILKMMHISISQICGILYDLSPKSMRLYSNKDCRIEIYNTLYAILMTPHYLCPPPTEMALKIIQTAYARDGSFRVRNRCCFILQNIEKIIHPQKESLLFTIEARDIRNTFIKMGQESLLQDFGYDFSNKSSNNNAALEPINTVSSEFLNTSVNNHTDDELELNNKSPTNDTIISTNSEKFKNKNVNEEYINKDQSNEDFESEVIMDQVNDNSLPKAIDTSTHKDKSNEDFESEFIMDQVNDNNSLPKAIDASNNNPENISKSHDFVLLNNNDADVGTLSEENTNDDLIDEPNSKRQKFDIENAEKYESQTVKTEIICNNVSIDDDEDNLLADIASQFVDELS